MENLLTLALLAAAVWWFYKYGKQTGSRKGYNAGRNWKQRR